MCVYMEEVIWNPERGRERERERERGEARIEQQHSMAERLEVSM